MLEFQTTKKSLQIPPLKKVYFMDTPDQFMIQEEFCGNYRYVPIKRKIESWCDLPL